MMFEWLKRVASREHLFFIDAGPVLVTDASPDVVELFKRTWRGSRIPYTVGPMSELNQAARSAAEQSTNCEGANT